MTAEEADWRAAPSGLIAPATTKCSAVAMPSGVATVVFGACSGPAQVAGGPPSN
jgi:hypothetical protein